MAGGALRLDPAARSHRWALPLRCPKCGGEMRIIFINEAMAVREILVHLGEPTSATRMTPVRDPSLWEMPDAKHRSPS